MHEMVRRANAASATVRRYSGRPFAFGRVDCVKLAAFHLRQMGHHQRLGLAKAGTYRSASEAALALGRAGFATVPDAIDALGFARIAPAEALTGDIIQMPGAQHLAALVIALGGGRVFGFHEDAVGAEVLEPVEMVTAWRIVPR